MPKVAKATEKIEMVVEDEAPLERPDDGMIRLRAKFPYADQFDGVEYFYDGEVSVVKGVVQIPADRHDWISRLLASDYELIDPAPADFV